MKTQTGLKALPHERGIAWVLTFLLAGCLAITILSVLTVQILTNAGLHLGIATDGAVVDSQLDHIYKNVDMLAGEYGFSADAVKKIINRDELLRINKEIAAWWTHLLSEGDTATMPRWYSPDLEKAVASSMNRDTAGMDSQTIAADLTDMVERTVFPLRETLLTTGMNLVNERADVPGVIRSVTRIPMLGLVLSIAVAGMIALFMGREINQSLKYYGTAAAGTGFSVLAALIILLCIGPKAMVAEASKPLAGEIGALLGKIGWEAGLGALLLLAVGYACLIVYRKKDGNMIANGETAE